jgi:phosphoserine phosphatase RsbU/P
MLLETSQNESPIESPAMLAQDDIPQPQPTIRVLFVTGESAKSKLGALPETLTTILNNRVHFECMSIRAAGEHVNANVHAVMICLSRNDNSSGLADVLDSVEMRNIPILILSDAPSTETSIDLSWNSLSMDESPHVMAAMLRGFFSRQLEIDALRKANHGAEIQTDRLLGEVTQMQDELHLAGQVQREFLPKTLPTFSGGAVAALWRPMNYVSGDIYDVRRLDEHHVGLFIADAVGHGVPAALLTMVIARGLPTKEINGNTYRIIQPSEALACVNRELLARQSNTTRFATAIYAIIDLRTRVMRMSIAGHPAAMVMRGTQSIEMVSCPGSLVGVFDGVEWSEKEIQLYPGDRILLYSDGFEFAFLDPPESQSSSHKSSPRYVNELHALLSITEPADMIAAMERRLDQQLLSANPQEKFTDDLTLIAFKVL